MLGWRDGKAEVGVVTVLTLGRSPRRVEPYSRETCALESAQVPTEKASHPLRERSTHSREGGNGGLLFGMKER